MEETTGKGLDSLQRYNRLLILKVIKAYSPTTRIAVAKLTKLSLPTVSSAVNYLIKHNLVKETGKEAFSGGRRSKLIEFNPKAYFIVGASVDTNSLVTVIGDLNGNMIEKTKNKIDITGNADKEIQDIIAAIHQIIEKSAVNKDKIGCIGLSLPGVLDTNKGNVKLSIPLGWKNVPVKKIIEDEFGIPTFMENDGTTAAWGEKCVGAGSGENDLIYIGVGKGIKTGIVIGGKLYRGVTGSAGEIGHMAIDKNGPRCSCGNYGCLQVMVPRSAIESQAKKAIKEGVETLISELAAKNGEVTAEAVLEARKKEDKLAFNIMEKVGEYLGIAIADVIDFLNPAMVIIGEDIPRFGEAVLDSVKRTVKSRSLPIISAPVKIVLSKLGKEASLVGTLILGAQKIIEFLKLDS